jgi:lipid-binding SYLF domain-containing protein
MNKARRGLLTGAALVAAGVVAFDREAYAASQRQINQQVDQALRLLYATQPRARELSQHATAILVFPRIIKAGLLIGGQGGDGALRIGGRTIAYYNIAAASFGLQAGAQTFSYAMFFMNNAALRYLQDSNGWSIGSGPSVVVMDKGAAASLTSTTLTQDVYAFPFGQQGLMAGVGLEGSKITQIQPTP